MHNNTRRRLVLLGLEDAQGELTTTLAALPVQTGFTMAPEGESQARDIVRPSMSKAGASIGAKNWNISLPLELTGGGLDATSNELNNPPIHPCLLASGMVQEQGVVLPITGITGHFKTGALVTNATAQDTLGTVLRFIPGANATQGTLWLRAVEALPAEDDELLVEDEQGEEVALATAGQAQKSLIYRFESDRSQHLTAQVHAHFDGQRRIATRCAANFSFDWKAGEFTTVQFTLNGVYQSPSDQPLPDATLIDIEPPIGQNAGLTLGDYPAAQGTIETLTFDAGIDIQPIPDINSPNGRKLYRIADRAAKGSLDPEVTPLAKFNPWQLWENGNKAAIAATLGNQPGYKISLVIPAPRITGLADEERAGSDVQKLDFEATGSNDDEFYFMFH